MVNYCKSKKCLSGKTAIITGANSGIGYITALEFAKRGCRTILACRNLEKANEAKTKLINLTNNENIIVKLIDVASLTSVRDFCKDINATEDRLDILVNNAGAFRLPDKITSDELQLEMAVNYFSPFLITNLLLDLLKKSAPSRIVNVSSLAASMGNLHLAAINKHKGHYTVYGKSKLCLNLFTIELAKRLEGSNVTAYSLHPGVVQTQIVEAFATNPLAKMLMLSPEEGAQTTIYCSLESDIEQYSGRHFENCKPVKDYCRVKKNMKKSGKLWEISEKLVGIKE